MDQGGLNIPTDSYCQWAIFWYIMFNSVKDVTCRRSLNNLFLLVSDRYDLSYPKNNVTHYVTYSLRTIAYCFHQNPIKCLD